MGDDGGRYRPRDEFDGGYWPEGGRGQAAEGQYATFGPREDSPRESGPWEGGPWEGGPWEGGPREGGPWEGGPGPGRRVPGPPPHRVPEAAGGGSAAPAAATGRPYGRILIFTLLDDRAADFDRLAEQAAEQVRTGEPDTLVYVIHLVPDAPMQRIFYEVYRDRAAFDSHENQPYMQRFVAERRTCVLATNAIELRLKYAKVAPLPTPRPTGPPGPQPLAPLPPALPYPGQPRRG